MLKKDGKQKGSIRRLLVRLIGDKRLKMDQEEDGQDPKF